MPDGFHGRLYRAINPVFAREPLSGHGAALYGGRFNPKGMPALYTSLSVMTALREANRVGDLQPITLVCYAATIERIFDTRDPAALDSAGVDEGVISDPGWRDEMRVNGEAASQRLARRLVASGHHGLLVRSFAPGTGPDDLNLVLWSWGDGPPAQLRLIDDEDRLSR